MITQNPQQNTSPTNHRIVLSILVVLFLISVGALVYPEYAHNPDVKLWQLLVNALLISIPMLLLYGSAYILYRVWSEHKDSGYIQPRLAQAVHWAPRVAGVLIILFISMFSLDVFEMEGSPLELLGAFLIHNIPSIVMIVLLSFAWKRPAVGFWAFLIGGILFGALFVRSFYALGNLFIFVIPILLIASLFYADWKWLSPPAAKAA